jgi:tetratricopeptide (TPR) repeat protein
MVKNIAKNIITILIFSVCSISAQTNEELFSQAQKEYSQCHFDNALQLFSQINNKSAYIWYNMGNCAYQLGNDLNALLFWQRAYHYGNASIVFASAFNIEQLQKKLGIYQAGIFNKILQALKNMIKIIPLILFQILFLCLLSILFFFIYRWQKQYLLLSNIFIILLASGIILKIKYDEQWVKGGLIIENKVNLYAGPDKSFHELFSLPAGSFITILAKQNDWIKINSLNKSGWIEKKYLEII